MVEKRNTVNKYCKYIYIHTYVPRLNHPRYTPLQLLSDTASRVLGTAWVKVGNGQWFGHWLEENNTTECVLECLCMGKGHSMSTWHIQTSLSFLRTIYHIIYHKFHISHSIYHIPYHITPCVCVHIMCSTVSSIYI